MLAPRRFLPPTHFLASFVAAARTGSFTRAARELSLTQGAVSRHIRALEDRLGVSLFVRDRQRVRLTDAGANYAREVREALDGIARASLALQANPEGGSLNLAILPTFGTRWLAPRLPRFLSLHTGVSVNLTTRLRPFDFNTDRQDAAIHFGKADWPGTGSVHLMDERVVPVASPEFLSRHPVGRAED
ncbi:MAG: LysR family transcriptional regulator, partial [Paracoccaceae bacterium]